MFILVRRICIARILSTLLLFVFQLELLSEEEKQLPTVTFCTLLDQHLVVGSYDQVRLLFSYSFLVKTFPFNTVV